MRLGCFTGWAWPGEARTYGGGVTVAGHRRALNRLVSSCRAGLDLVALRGEVLDGLRPMTPVDAAFFATVDPVTLLFTSVSAEAPVDAATPLFLGNVYGRDDVKRFRRLGGHRR
jgi:hypothetical protein